MWWSSESHPVLLSGNVIFYAMACGLKGDHLPTSPVIATCCMINTITFFSLAFFPLVFFQVVIAVSFLSNLQHLSKVDTKVTFVSFSSREHVALVKGAVYHTGVSNLSCQSTLAAGCSRFFHFWVTPWHQPGSLPVSAKWEFDKSVMLHMCRACFLKKIMSAHTHVAVRSSPEVNSNDETYLCFQNCAV